MAQNIISSINNDRGLLYAFGILSLLLVIQKGDAFQFMVGGGGKWSVPSDANILNQWAEKNRFQTGDTLLFVYYADKDSVLLVKKEDYDNCNTDSPLKKYTDGHTVFQFNHSGPHYFISGVKEHCQKNEKVHIVVMADRSGKGSNQTVSSPPPAPSAEVPPSSAPGGQEAPPPAPSQESSPPSPSGASLIDMSVVGSIGAFIGSVLLVS
ncbi:hypothetical protein LIER_32689 [Lithospermum erythrorhizon]|uniref:Phytocyanin domain-containing protein n=1 Tax=Lithospermum erythrorhizon TaxID=34254 RepID=A0AAV3RZX1_LITER